MGGVNIEPRSNMSSQCVEDSLLETEILNFPVVIPKTSNYKFLAHWLKYLSGSWLSQAQISGFLKIRREKRRVSFSLKETLPKYETPVLSQ